MSKVLERAFLCALFRFRSVRRLTERSDRFRRDVGGRFMCCLVILEVLQSELYGITAA